MTVEDLEGQAIGCTTCGQPLDIRLDKRGKPYVQCEDCAVQIFIRGRHGIQRLMETVQDRSHQRGRSAAIGGGNLLTRPEGALV